MKSNNPVFARSGAFNGQGGYAGFDDRATTATYPGNDYGTPYGTPEQGSVAQSTDRMTIDSVVQKSAITLLVVIATAALTWWWTGDSQLMTDAQYGQLIAAMGIGSLGAFALSMVNSFKRVVSPALVLAFAALEGVALGALSKFIGIAFAGGEIGLVINAVIGTFGAFAGTLAAYKFFDIKVGQRFRTFVIAAVFGMVGLSLLSLVLSLFGIQTGLFGFGALGLLTAVAGLALGVFMLILDFDMIERGVAMGVPDREAWRAAFGLTVSLVWIYTNLLRIMAILRGD